MKPQHAQLFATDLDEDDADQVPRPLPDVLRPHGGSAAAHGHLAQQPRGRHRLPARASSSTTRWGSAPSSRRRWPQVVDTYAVRVEDDARGSREAAALPAVREQRRRRPEHRVRPPSATSTGRRPGTEKADRAHRRWRWPREAAEGRPPRRPLSAIRRGGARLRRRLRARRHHPRHGRLRAVRRPADRHRARRRRRRRSTPSTTSIRSATPSCISRGIVGDRAASPRSRRRSSSRASICARVSASTIRPCASGPTRCASSRDGSWSQRPPARRASPSWPPPAPASPRRPRRGGRSCAR